MDCIKSENKGVRYELWCWARIKLMLLLVLLPLVGIIVGGKPIVNYIQFPPLTQYVQHAAFSWPVFIGLLALILVAVCPFAVRVLISRLPADISEVTRRPFPAWGWVGVCFTILAWVVAWNEFAWLKSIQVFTFTPLWLGYIVVVNAWTYQRTGHCMLLDRRRHLVLLFIGSAVFWWYFEYLNRFVQNWHYRGIGGLSRFQYFVYATLPFSTVLPAVLGTQELLESVPRVSAGLRDFVKIRLRHHQSTAAWFALTVFCASLACIGIWPSYLFPLLWVSPLFVITCLQVINGRRTVFAGIAEGNWTEVWLLALSALICGFFWEMWNYRSAAQWIYAVPFVNKFKIFEMPVLGYAGYLPFGLECAVIAKLVTSNDSLLPITDDR